MKTYDEILEEVKQEYNLSERPYEEFKWFAYKNGSALEFDTEAEARRLSSMVERVVVNQEDISEWVKEHNEIVNIAYSRFKEMLWYRFMGEVENNLPLFHACLSSVESMRIPLSDYPLYLEEEIEKALKYIRVYEGV